MHPSRPILIVCADRFGREIVLYEDTWFDHILERRPELTGREGAVASAIQWADHIRVDRKLPDARC